MGFTWVSRSSGSRRYTYNVNSRNATDVKIKIAFMVNVSVASFISASVSGKQTIATSNISSCSSSYWLTRQNLLEGQKFKVKELEPVDERLVEQRESISKLLRFIFKSKISRKRKKLSLHFINFSTCALSTYGDFLFVSSRTVAFTWLSMTLELKVNPASEST